MTPHFHNHMFTFTSMGDPLLYLLVPQDYTGADWELSLNTKNDSIARTNDQNGSVLLTDNARTQCYIDARLSPERKQLIYRNRKEAKIIIIKTIDFEALRSLLSKRLKLNLSHSIQREKELGSDPSANGTFSRHTTVVEKMISTSPHFLEDAFHHHWIHLLTGLLLVEGEKRLLESGKLPLWSAHLLSSLHISPLDIRLTA
jgi:hypothetical protein